MFLSNLPVVEIEAEIREISNPPAPKDKITQILQGHATRPVNEEILKKDEEEVKKETKTPLSLEEMIEAKRAKEEELSKPKFLTKAERAKLALEKRQKEADEKRRQMDELREKQREIFKQVRNNYVIIT